MIPTNLGDDLHVTAMRADVRGVGDQIRCRGGHDSCCCAMKLKLGGDFFEETWDNAADDLLDSLYLRPDH